METQRYNHRSVEAKWQHTWQKNKTFSSKLDLSKPKYYVLDMFPYPSGSGLHVGHPVGYTATDIVARYKRQKGFNVLHPMGWDSFGLPAEQYALRTGTHPATTTKKNIAHFRRQLSRLGFSYDWDREISTSDPKYYKWTQWIFTKLCEKGLAYEAYQSVNYCPALGTVLANEEVENGCSKEGGHPVIRKPLKQWVLKITSYAERLIEDLQDLDWPEGLKKLQINWIGKSVGANVLFEVSSHSQQISVFTTRVDTIGGATFLVLAPEHPLIDAITPKSHKKEVLDYVRAAGRKSDLQRTELNKDKTGVFTGAYAVNPWTKEPIPIWIADYVLAGYGTAAVMAVPAHDERDFAFAKRYNLPVRAVYEPEKESDLPKGMDRQQACQLLQDGMLCYEKEGVYCKDTPLQGLRVEEAKGKVTKWLQDRGFGNRAVSYKLRDWLFSRQRYWGEPFPVLHFEDGSYRILEADELPVILPDMEDFRPSEDGLSPLAKVHDWVEVWDEKTKQKARRETNTMPNWAGSCWYYLRFCDPGNDQEAFDFKAQAYWMPVDLYIGGVEHAVLHLLYARFWHKVLFDCGYVSTKEPFYCLRNQGLVCARSYQKSSGAYVPASDVEQKDGCYFLKESGEPLRSQIEKMSKSKLNGLSPDEIIDEFGADSLRVYEMFMGPLEKEKFWNTDAVAGAHRFLCRFYDAVTSSKVTEEDSEKALKLAYRLAHDVAEDIEALQFNTAIAKMMTFVNDLLKLPAYPKKALRIATQALAPFAPHLAEEAWQILGGATSISFVPYPEIEERYLQEEMATYVVQINGRLRGKFDLPKGRSQQQIQELAQNHPLISKHLGDAQVRKLIFVPDKLLNFVLA